MKKINSKKTKLAGIARKPRLIKIKSRNLYIGASNILEVLSIFRVNII